MTKYDLVENSREIPARNRDEIRPGCTCEQDDWGDRIVKSFDNKAEALEALKAYRSDVRRENPHGVPYYLVTEYYVEKNDYDEDGDWEGGGDVVAFSEMPKEWRQ